MQADKGFRRLNFFRFFREGSLTFQRRGFGPVKISSMPKKFGLALLLEGLLPINFFCGGLF